MGRFLADRLSAAAQVVITTHITPGIDGRAKGVHICLSGLAAARVSVLLPWIGSIGDCGNAMIESFRGPRVNEWGSCFPAARPQGREKQR
jgi:hypothetical protein